MKNVNDNEQEIIASISAMLRFMAGIEDGNQEALNEALCNAWRKLRKAAAEGVSIPDDPELTELARVCYYFDVLDKYIEII